MPTARLKIPPVARLVEAVAGSWRQNPPGLEWEQSSLDSVLRPLIASGCGALVWRRICRNESLSASAAGASLHDLWRLNVLKVSEQQRQLSLLFARLAQAKIKGILLKGLSVANLYPDPRLRPVGDIDLYVGSEQFDDAKKVIAELADEGVPAPVDLEHEASNWTNLSFGEALGRSGRLNVGGATVRVLGAEDNLRFLCLHFLQHGGGRALWLCDVAAAVENRPAGFDWDLCLGTRPAVRNWVASVISLAGNLLGAKIDDTPIAQQEKLPNWFPKTVLSQWASKVSGNMDGPGTPVPSPLGPVTFIRALRRRWPDPISATVRVGGRLDNSPRLIYQLRWAFQRAAKFYFRRSPDFDPSSSAPPYIP
jgi:hypothetical protein